jgi:rifampin ADP-ribosylating transferase
VLVDPALSYDGEFPDAVMGSEGDGGFAEYLVAAVDRVHDVSDSPLSDAQLACLPTAYGTALGMINRADCAAGERVLVTGSAGGVGGAAIQLLVDRGCHVVARTSPGKAELVAAGGAHEVSVRGVDEIAVTDEVDVVVDVVGGEEFGELLDRLRTGGRMVTAGAIAGPVVALDVRRLYLRQRRLFGSTMHTPDDVAELARLASEGRIAPRVAEVLPLSELHEAQRRFLAKDFVGKLVVAPPGTGATVSIAESIAASAGTEHVPVTFERCDHVEGPFFHGTRAVLGIGDQLVPGTPSNYHDGRTSNHVYFAALLEPAVWAAELATALGGSGERGRIYVVQPTGPFEDDPNVTDKKFPGNVTRSYRTRHPMLVVGEVEHWEGHAPEVLQGMLDNIARLRDQGRDVIED